ncbi:MAG TPA: hypothetical protein VGG20_25415 [Thermoanaerobaculia bacterium]|jgi:hypothetical protein
MSFNRRFIVYLLLLSLSALPARLYAESKSSMVKGPRPVAQAVEQLESLYGFPITYEDPPYVHESEKADVTDQVHRDRQNGDRVLIPKGGSFSYAYILPDAGAYPGGGLRQTTAVVADVLANMLQSHAASRNGEMFNVTRSNGLFHVVPTHFINESGKVEQLTPLLSMEINISLKSRTSMDLVKEICESLSLVTGQTVILGTIPSSLLASHTTRITTSGEAARSILSRSLQEFNIPLSWQLFYDPGSHVHVLNIHVVTLANK